jgi:hypothetical protein
MDHLGNRNVYVLRLDTGFCGDAFKQAILQHGGNLKEMSQLVKAARHVLEDAGKVLTRTIII